MKKYIPYLILTLLFFSLGSCKKSYLDTEPSDQISSDKLFDNINNVRVALNGVYRLLYMQYSDQEQDGHAAIMIVMDFMGEDIVHTAAGTSYFRGAYKWTDHRAATNDLPYFSYRMYYRVIANINRILDGIDTVPGATDAEKNPIKGECLALRGWAHHMLVQLFAKRYNVVNGVPANNDASGKPNLGVPIMTTYSEAPQPRATVEEVYTQINKDLDQAIIYLTGASARGIYRTHVDVSVAKGFKARVALTQDKWEDAAKYALEALQGYQLMSNAAYLDGFTDMKNSEWMWGAHQLPEQLPTYGSFYAYMSSNFNSAHTRPNPKKINQILYGEISNTDVRKKLFCNNVNDYLNFPGVINAGTGLSEPSQVRALYMQKKFVVSDPAVSAGDIPFMRAAEMYLIAAEAKAHRSLNVEAEAILKTLAINRDPSYETPQDLSGILEIILTQRRIELWGEGFRFLDLKRLDKTLNRNGTGTTSTLATSASMEVPAGDNRWQFLIPRREIQANPYMVQND
ncbi:RagB/SusD family nutrient uptake outer membrane protein [Pedobacter sp. ASV28]|jgi:starch-binding outer membrane protein, SusD/RagB family|uniref:RagB/SusD family nutrient uptake outer membrane protein n=1 Tax=Pedobacter sp. ASV28 TaxID=2795123 RepID=UPI0018ED6431|nr:RagB/SusD family nutrient uptake outer membrane protein [Pedobacter sp. ASV28]